MEMNQIIEAINGKGEFGKGKAAFTILNELYDIGEDSLKTIGSMSLFKPVFKIERHGRFVQVDMIFLSNLDMDLTRVMILLSQFGEHLDMCDGSDNIRPLLTLCIVPVKLEGRVYIQAMNPITWGKTTDTAGGSTLNTIRMLFESIDFNAFENPDADASELENEIMKEEENKRFLIEQDERRKAARKERNDTFESLSKEEYLAKSLYEDSKKITHFEDLL